MRAAAIDIGTNSIRLLVAEITEQGVTPLDRLLLTTRLGAGLPQYGFLSTENKHATLQALLSFRDRALSLGARRIRVVGTSALREAEDGRDFAKQLGDVAGLHVEVLSSEDEAFLSYQGVLHTLQMPSEALVFDLGGGSCELIWRDGGRLRLHSLKIGAVYIREDFFRHDPPTALEITAARQFIRSQLAEFPLCGKNPVGLGGTVTNLAAMAMGMSDYNADLVHGFVLQRQTINDLLVKMLSMPEAERRGLAGIQPSRAEILPAGTLVVNELLLACGSDTLTVSEGDILTGCIYGFISSA